MSNKNNPKPYYIGAGILLAIAVVVLLYAFVIPQPCDIDRVYLWCHTHPVTGLDILGAILLIVGTLYQVVLWVAYNNTVNFTRMVFNWLGLVAFLVGVILMWI